MSESRVNGEGVKGKRVPKGNQGNGGPHKALVAAGVVALLMAVALIGIFVARSSLGPPAATPAASAALSEYNTTTMSVPASSVGSTARFYEYNTSGATVRFFVVKDADGNIRTAFDECPMCYGKHLGFRQTGDTMTENCCNMSFPISSIGPGRSGCRPEYLPSRIEGGKVMIAKTGLMSGAYMFRVGTEPAAVEAVNQTTVSIPLSSVSSAATWHTCDVSGATVRFFVVKDCCGTVRTAFDECPMCYRTHLGFRQEGTSMVENCCEMPYSIEAIAPNVTGCHPEYLASRIEGEKVMISMSNLAAGSYMFRMSGEASGAEMVDASTVAVALSPISGVAHWYSVEINGTTVRFFVVKDAAGAVHAAMDTCPKCYKKHAGFRQDGEYMVENCCNMPFPIVNITADGCKGTGCHPAFLPSRVEGDRVLMATADLEAGSYMFK
jgi:uncharacterized membrane protein